MIDARIMTQSKTIEEGEIENCFGDGALWDGIKQAFLMMILLLVYRYQCELTVLYKVSRIVLSLVWGVHFKLEKYPVAAAVAADSAAAASNISTAMIIMLHLVSKLA